MRIVIEVPRCICLCILLALLLAIGSPTQADAQRRRPAKKATVGIVSDGPWAGTAAFIASTKKEVADLLGAEFIVSFPADKTLDGGFDPVKIKAAIDSLLADPDVDLIYTMGLVASHDVGHRSVLSKPVIAPFIIDRRLQGLPFKKGASGRKNLAYIAWPWSVERDLEVLREVTAADHIVFLASEYLLKAIPELPKNAAATAKKSGMTVDLIAVGADVDAAVASLPKHIRAAYLAPLPQLSAADFEKLLVALNRRRIATFSVIGEQAVRQGALVGRRPADGYNRIARRLAINTQKILSGGKASKLPVAISLPERLIVNLKTARMLGMSPSWAVLTEAEVVDEERKKVKRTVSLASVVAEAMKGNVNIKALEQTVRAGRAGVRVARANLLPQLDANTTFRTIDKDRAATAFGKAPQHLLNGELSLTQVLWSEKAWAGLGAEKSLQRGRREQLQQQRLDVAAEVGVAYYNLLRAKTAEAIQKNNLVITRANLDLARTRVDAGTSSRADVYRWEAQIATDRKSVIEASARRNLGEIDLQRILHRPPEERFSTAESDILSPSVINLQQGLFRFMADPWTFRLFRKFVVAEALRVAPELRRFDAILAAQRRVHKSAKRAPYSPTVALKGSVLQRFDRRGVGSDSVMGEPNGTEWFVGLSMSMPLYAGGARYAEIERKAADLRRLERERDAVRDLIRQRAASHLHSMGASYAGIRLSRVAATAARKNYQLVAAAYAQGAVRIVDLLDAQNASVTAERVAADSVYRFLIDWLNVQRSAGQFMLLMSPEEQQDLVARLSRYVAAQKKLAMPN